MVTTNPPYMNESHGLKNPEDAKAIARHEVKCTLEDVVREGTRVLKPGGRFCMVHRPRRLIEIITVMKRHGLEPKRMKMVHPYADREANMVLIEAVRGGGPLLKICLLYTSYMDGCKVYFKNGGWVIARFSGTEPLLRIFLSLIHI